MPVSWDEMREGRGTSPCGGGESEEARFSGPLMKPLSYAPFLGHSPLRSLAVCLCKGGCRASKGGQRGCFGPEGDRPLALSLICPAPALSIRLGACVFLRCPPPCILTLSVGSPSPNASSRTGRASSSSSRQRTRARPSTSSISSTRGWSSATGRMCPQMADDVKTILDEAGVSREAFDAATNGARGRRGRK